jgi:hypothetical protein
MIVRPAALQPTKKAFGLGDPHVVDAGVALGRVSVSVKQPILIAVTTPPLSLCVVGFVYKARTAMRLSVNAHSFLISR